MSMISINVKSPDHETGPQCNRCASATRLIGVEPHPTKAHTDLRTFQCLACDHVQAAIVPLAS